MNKIAAVLLAFLLAGCETPQGDIDQLLPRYQGKPAELLLQRWGMPARKFNSDGGVIYIWQDQPPARNCRIEAHVDERARLLGLKTIGDDHGCVVWLRLLK